MPLAEDIKYAIFVGDFCCSDSKIQLSSILNYMRPLTFFHENSHALASGKF